MNLVADFICNNFKGGFIIKIYREDNAVYIKLKESISFLSVGDLKTQIYDFIQDDDDTLIINLSKVDFIDSAGLGLLISLLKYMKGRNGRMVVEYPTLGVQKLIEMTRLDELFEVKKTPEPKTGSWSEFI
ncbi:MAG TPA: STAS domain-containing protein [Clostridia bacterium]|nr:STAS domain-containing protein [Clostridia bacterium]